MRLLIHSYTQMPRKKASWPVLSPCNISGLKAIAKKYADEGVVVFVSHEGCGACKSARTALNDIIRGRKPIVEMPVEIDSCNALADRMKVFSTPTIFFFKHGSMRPFKKLVGYGDSESRKELEKIAES